MIKLLAARQALVQSFAFGWEASGTSALDLQATVQGTKKGNLGRIVNGALCSRVVCEVEKQREVERAWLKLAYGPWFEKNHPGDEYFYCVEKWLRDRFWSKYVESNNKAKIQNVDRILTLFMMVKPAIREQLYNSKTGKKLLATTDVQKQSSASAIHIKNWGRDFADQLDMMLGMLDELDRKSLQPVARLVVDINKDVEEELMHAC